MYVERMRMVWLVSLGVIVAAGVIVRGLRRHRSAEISQEAVSGEWLAHERGREEQQW